jgi:sugar lactone lactonase YvrE
MLGGAEGTTLFMMAADWTGPENVGEGPRTGKVLAAQAPAPHVGWP